MPRMNKKISAEASRSAQKPTQEKFEVISPEGKVEPVNLVDEMQRSYLDYAMSVIVARALPDVRDGLKPVHRRILYAMWNIGLRHSAKFRKSAHVVGEVMAKYHPHGDAAIYDSMVRMAQDFSMRSPLVNGQGNFGSMDGDAPAAMRYTEAKLQALAEEMLADIEKNTVNFVANYDGSTREPLVLPSKLPNLLLNGSMGIAVGMATNIPPHNLGELCDGVMAVIDNPKLPVEELMEYIPGPDFPTGGIIYNKKDIAAAYATGRGGIVIRAKTEIVERKDGQYQIVVAEIPYQINKATLLEKIAALVHEKKIEGIRDLRDESNKEGVRIVIDLKKDSYPKKVLNRLFKLTDLQTTFHVNILALIDGLQPRVLNLKSILEEYIKHRQVVIRRRTEFDLEKNKERAHILEGLSKALDKIDAVINTIRKSKDKDEAKINLMAKFKFTERQTVAILEMRLQQLANLERQKIEDELKEKRQLIKELESILASDKKILEIIKKEIREIKEKFADERRTQIVAHGIKEFSMEDLIPNESTIIMATRDGYIKRIPPDTFRTQGRGGKGIIGLTPKEEDVVDHLITTNTHDDLLFFTTRGRVFELKAYDVPEAKRTSKGQAMVNFLQLAPNEKVLELLVVSANGLGKKTKVSEYKTQGRGGGGIKTMAVTEKTGKIISMQVINNTEEHDLMIISVKGQVIRTPLKTVPTLGRATQGVRIMRFKLEDDKVASITLL